MSYDYIRRTYDVDPVPGQRVRHRVTKREGTIRPEPPSHAHYVHVCFDGDEFSRPCHPTELDYLGALTEETCPGHVAAAHDVKVCGRCGIHIDELRPDDDADPINLAGSGPVPIEPREC